MYSVKEIFKTIQGEGYWTGRPAIFVRFAGCNLWSGREEDRSKAICQFCDTDFVDGEKIATSEIVSKSVNLWGNDQDHRFLVMTGGEPTLQVESHLIDMLHGKGFTIAIETNGTRLVNPLIDWVTVSPKAGSKIIQVDGDEIKLVYPQVGAKPERYTGMAFDHWFIQPMDGPDRERNARLAIDYCLANPKWRLSLQTHKFVGLA